MSTKTTTKKPASKKPTPKRRAPAVPQNRIAILLDSSASMKAIASPAVRAFNERVRAIHGLSRAEGQESTVTFITFGGDERREYRHTAGAVLGDQVRVEHFNADPAQLRPLDHLACGGNTPMLSAIRKAVELLRAMPDAGDPNVSFLVEVIMDGEENSSFPTTAADVQRLMREVIATDRWTFVFSVPSQGHKEALGGLFGIPEDCVQVWETTAQGVEVATCSTTAGYGDYFAARSAGQRSVTSFFTTDLSKVRPTAMRKALTDVSAHIKLWTVERETSIKDFVEAKNRGSYLLGAAYYQLTKPETIQPHKAVLIMEKGKDAVYGGPEARALLGLPAGGDVKVKPGNHAAYDIFVQSTSVNRKLVRGTRLLYRMDHGAPSQPTWGSPRAGV